jgi:hypothetical protein
MNEPVRIAMWSGPRNISTALMRSFEARGDCDVVDEPFYGCFLKATNLDHPLRDETIASMATDWRDVVPALTGPSPTGRAIFYQKHMAHHMLPGFSLEWTSEVRSAYLIRDPVLVLASYTEKRAEVTLADIGFPRLNELFEREADRLSHAPPVIEGADVLGDPSAMLSRLCSALGIEWTPHMLSWPSGRRTTDGVWAPAWYDAVERSTGFGPPPPKREIRLPPHLQRLAEEAGLYYEALAKWKLS